MPQIEGWFRARKSLPNRRRVYYEDVYGRKNPEEDLEGVHIIDSESDSEPSTLSRRVKRRDSDKTRATPHNNISSHDNEQAMKNANSDETATTAIGTVVTIDDDSDVDESFIDDLQRHGMFARNIML